MHLVKEVHLIRMTIMNSEPKRRSSLGISVLEHLMKELTDIGSNRVPGQIHTVQFAPNHKKKDPIQADTHSKPQVRLHVDISIY